MTTLGGPEHKVELAEDYLSAVSALMIADLQAPMNDELKITLMVGRRKLLDTYVDVSAVLMQMMGQMSPVDDLVDFNTTKEAIRQYGLWAQNGLIEIERMHD